MQQHHQAYTGGHRTLGLAPSSMSYSTVNPPLSDTQSAGHMQQLACRTRDTTTVLDPIAVYYDGLHAHEVAYDDRSLRSDDATHHPAALPSSYPTSHSVSRVPVPASPTLPAVASAPASSSSSVASSVAPMLFSLPASGRTRTFVRSLPRRSCSRRRRRSRRRSRRRHRHRHRLSRP